MLGKIEGGRRRGRQRMRWLDGVTDSMDMGLGGLRILLGYQSIRSQRVGHDGGNSAHIRTYETT